MKKILLILVCVSCLFSALAQNMQVSGRVVDQNREPIQAVTVCCRLIEDSTLVAGCMTNADGLFTLSVATREDAYRLILSFIGYKEYTLRIQGNGKNLQLGTLVLTPDSKQLEEVVVTGTQMTRTIDKIVYFPSREQLKNVSNGFNALAVMMIPKLDVDPFSKTVSTLQGATKLLINGREASNVEIQNLNPKDIQRIDFYEQHHPEYPLASSVVDYILIHRDGGGTIAINSEQHLNKGTGNYSVTGQFFKKKSEFAAYINDDYNHYTQDRGAEVITNLKFPDSPIVNKQSSLPSLSKKNQLNSYFNYIYQDRQMQFYASAIFSQENSDKDIWNMQTYSNEITRYKVQDFSNTRNLNPALILSIRRNMKHNQTLRVGLRGSYNDNEYDRIYNAYHNEVITNSYKTIAKEDFFNVVPSLMYVKNAKNKNTFFVSAFYDHIHTNTDYLVDNKISKDRQTLINSNVTVGYAIRTVKRLRLTVQAGNYLHAFDNGVQSYVKYIFRPGVFAAYQIKRGHMLNGAFGIGSGDPGVEYRADTEQQIDKYQIRKGNPNIETVKLYTANLDYSWDSKYATLSYVFKYDQTEDFPYARVEYDSQRNVFIHDYAILGRSKILLTGPSVRFKIIPQKLTLDIAGYYLRKEYSYWRTFTLNRFESSAKILFMYKNIMAMAQVSAPKKEYDNGSLLYMPWTYNFNVGYTVGNWHLEFATRNPFSSVIKDLGYLTERYSRYSRIYAPRINDHIFYMTVNYRFSFGKRHRFNDIQLENTGGSTILKTN